MSSFIPPRTALFLRLLSHSLRTSRSLRCDVHLFRAKLYLNRESFYTSISAQDQQFLYNLPSIYFCWFMTTPAEVQEVSRREALGLLTPEKLEEQRVQVGLKIDSNIWEWSFASYLVNRSFVVFSSCKLLEKTLLEVRDYPLFKAQIKTLTAMKDFNDACEKLKVFGQCYQINHLHWQPDERACSLYFLFVASIAFNQRKEKSIDRHLVRSWVPEEYLRVRKFKADLPFQPTEMFLKFFQLIVLIPKQA